jgi:hypothetical protein
MKTPVIGLILAALLVSALPARSQNKTILRVSIVAKEWHKNSKGKQRWRDITLYALNDTFLKTLRETAPEKYNANNLPNFPKTIDLAAGEGAKWAQISKYVRFVGGIINHDLDIIDPEENSGDLGELPPTCYVGNAKDVVPLIESLRSQYVNGKYVPGMFNDYFEMPWDTVLPNGDVLIRYNFGQNGDGTEREYASIPLCGSKQLTNK